MDKKTIIVVGAGKGLGNHIAKRFGKEGFRVILMARNKQSLQDYKHEFAAEGIETYTYCVDAAKPETLTEALQQAENKLGTPDVFIYNVGITTPDEPGKQTWQNLCAIIRRTLQVPTIVYARLPIKSLDRITAQ